MDVELVDVEPVRIAFVIQLCIAGHCVVDLGDEAGDVRVLL